jgi:hypothetical protein
MLELGFEADTTVDIELSPLIATQEGTVIVSSIYIPGYTLTV